jgi:hypothetical protein
VTGAGNELAVRVPRRATLYRLAGLVAGVLAAILLATAPPHWLGLGLMLAVPAFSLCLLAGVLMGELVTAPALGPTRTAALEVRTARRYLPRAMTGWVAGLLIALVALLTATTLAASADNLGRAGRSLSRACSSDHSASAGPWPGSYYSLPMAAVVILGLGAAALVVRTVARRHRHGSDPDQVAADDHARRLSARIVTAACGILVATPLAGSALVAGAELLRFDCPTQSMRLAGWVALGVAVVAGLSGCAFAAEILLPRRRP